MLHGPLSPTSLPQGERGFDGSAVKASDSPSPLVGEGLGRGSLRNRARTLRGNQTDAEHRLWKLLRAKRLQGWKFRRQFPIGRYIVDFACPTARLIIEADGGQHNDNAYDTVRDQWLTSEGWRVIRFWNTGILTNEEGVLSAIIASLPPLPNPSPTRGEGLSGAPTNG